MTWRPHRWAMTLLAAVAVLLGASGVKSLRDEPRLIGMQLHALWAGVSDGEADRQLDLARSAGATLVRVDVGWSTLERQGKGRRDPEYLRRVDRLVKGAAARDLKLLFTFADTPCWASSAPEELRDGCTGTWWKRGVQRYLPRRPQDYADALAFLPAR